MVTPKPQPDALEAFNLANGFHEGAIRCGTDMDDPNTGAKVSPMAPTLVNAAFAAELYMKALVLRREPKVEGHNLNWLYKNALDDNERKTISKYYREITKTSDKQLLASLERFGRAFTEWRYVYESSEQFTDAAALFAFVRAAYSAVREIAPEWPVSDYSHSRLAAQQGLVMAAYFAEGTTLEQALATFGFNGPKPNVAKGNHKGPGFAILNPNFQGERERG